MITLATIIKARHLYATIGTEAKMDIERDAVYWLLTHTEIKSTTELRAISQDFVSDMPYDWYLDIWEALKKGEAKFILLERNGEQYLELDDPEDSVKWENVVASG